jgi:hypothetical protein
MLRAASGMIIVTAALCAVLAHAQNERPEDQRPAVRRPAPAAISPNWPEEEWCQSDPDKLTAMDKAVCADRALLDKHIRVGLMQRSLQRVVGFPRTLRFEQAHRTWLVDRARCPGPDVAACLHAFYDARIQELAHSIATEPLGKP